jgi:formiminoglutamase
MSYLKIYNKADVLSLVKVRRFETKLGECIQCLTKKENWEQELASSGSKFVIVGVPEDIGVEANYGMAGASTAWIPFLESFLNVQSNDFINGSELLLLGHLDFDEMSALISRNAADEDERINALRHAVTIIDDALEEVVKTIVKCGKIPIVIGGGHNNAYGCIVGSAKALYKKGLIPIAQINVINLDAHADYRPLEGRHSGNAFSYANEDGYLDKYFILGLHENYIQQNVWMEMVNEPFIDMISYEDIFIHEKRNFLQSLASATSFTEDNYCGIELDIDCIQDSLSSAMTPCGMQTAHARQYVNFTAADTKTAYFHICEGASRRQDGHQNSFTGKLISYLVSDFVKSKLSNS